MTRTNRYIIGLLGFFVMWGVFGFAAAAPRSQPDLQGTAPPIVNTPILPEATDAVGIPVTSEPEPLWMEILGFYGLIGVAALFLILALLSFANKSTASYVEHKSPHSEETHKN